MDEKISALYSEYIIDGIAQELTPGRILSSCLVSPDSPQDCGPFTQIVDESIDPDLKPCMTDPSLLDEYASAIASVSVRKFPVAFPETYTKCRIASALIDTIWKEGHFRLDDLAVRLDWSWHQGRIGDMSAFYSSVYSAADYTDSLGLKLSGYSYSECDGESSLSALTSISSSAFDEDKEDFFDELPFRTAHPQLGESRLHPSVFQPDPESWIIYIPFENCDYRLGASLLAQSLGVSGTVAPQIVDADYFIDCYEVVRELVEDGIVISGATVGDGGLMSALKSMSCGQAGASIDLADLVRAVHEDDIVRLLFSEVPGVVIQISDVDYDYVDAELLLQDVAFFPLGHPVPESSAVNVHASSKSGIQTILDSLMNRP